MEVSTLPNSMTVTPPMVLEASERSEPNPSTAAPQSSMESRNSQTEFTNVPEATDINILAITESTIQTYTSPKSESKEEFSTEVTQKDFSL